jgi:hypothetical protein
MRLVENQKGQFIIIAVMIISIMMVSLAATMYNVATYYEYENWEEYITLADHLRLNTDRLIEISLANFTTMGSYNYDVVMQNLVQWQDHSRKAYPDKGIILTFELANTSYQINNKSAPYFKGIAYRWNESFSFSAANVTHQLDMASIGLTGYRFVTEAFLSLEVINKTTDEITVSVKKENGMLVTDLKEDNFAVDNFSIIEVESRYDSEYYLVYTITCEGNLPASGLVSVWDTRGIKVVSRFG